MIKLNWFIKQSLILDFKFIIISRWSLSKKVTFIAIKYWLIAKHFFVKFSLGKDYVYFDGNKIYYDSKYGLAGYQSILARHQNLLKIAGVKNVKTMVDIGANVGFFSMLVRHLYPKSKIYAFEPMPITYRALSRNFEGDKRTKIFNMAIFNKNANLRMSFNGQNSAISKIEIKGDLYIKAKRLDNLTHDNKIDKIDILKIDVETFEDYVLRGARETLAKTKYLFIEITMENNKNYTISSLMSLLYSKKYNFQLLAFRNFADVDEGKIPLMDALLINKLYLN